MIKIALRILFGIFLIGWVYPAWLGTSFCRQGAEQSLQGTQNLNSFPYGHIGHQLQGIAAIWFFLSVVTLLYQLVIYRSHRVRQTK